MAELISHCSFAPLVGVDFHLIDAHVRVDRVSARLRLAYHATVGTFAEAEAVKRIAARGLLFLLGLLVVLFAVVDVESLLGRTVASPRQRVEHVGHPRYPRDLRHDRIDGVSDRLPNLSEPLGDWIPRI